MGTNYYVATNTCECCKRYDEEFHIGKSSVGWSFSFRGYEFDNLRSWKEWKQFLIDKIIVDEYGREVSYDEFVNMIETYKSPNFVNNGRINLNHNEEGKKGPRPWFDSRYDWNDEDGYSFNSREFS